MNFKLSLMATSFFASAALCVVAAPTAGAQEAAAGVAAETSDNDIVITAQRRSQRLQDVPIAVTALSAAQLETLGIANTNDLTQVAPGLTMSESSSFVQPFIRGVGSTTTNLGEQSSVATYIDGVYMPLMATAVYDLANISGIEVLKGPQGTLFGRNTSGGAILITTRAPSDTFTGRMEASYGNYNAVDLRGFVSGPITDMISASLAGNYKSHDGWMNDRIRGGDAGDSERYAIRGTVLIEPTSRMDITLNYDYIEADDPTSIMAHPVGPYQGQTTGSVVATDPYDYIGNVDPEYLSIQSGSSAKINYEFDGFDFMSLTAYRIFKTANVYDSDSTPLPATRIEDTERANAFSQEFQLSSNGDGPLSWMVGAFYYNQDSEYAPLLVVRPTSTLTILADHGNEAYAVFADGTYDFGKFELTAGVRYNHETKDLVASLNGSVLVPGSEETWESVTPRIVLSYKPSDDFLGYASFTQGYKSGAFTASSLSRTPIEPETVDAYEVGFKWTVNPDVTFNSSVYFYQTADLQVQAINPLTNTAVTANAAESESLGADFELSWRPTDALSMRFGAAYLNAEYTSFPNAQIFVRPTPADPYPALTSISADVTGNTIVRSPEWTFNMAADYTIDLAGGGSIVPSANLFYSSSYYWDAGNRLEQDPFTLINAQVTWNLPGDKVALSVWGRNLLDEEVYRTFTPSAQADRGLIGDPLTYGVRVGYEF